MPKRLFDSYLTFTRLDFTCICCIAVLEEIIPNEVSLGGSPTIKVTLIFEKLFVHYIEYYYKTKGKQDNHLKVDHAEILSPSKLAFAHVLMKETIDVQCTLYMGYISPLCKTIFGYLLFKYFIQFLGSTCSERVGMIPKTIYGQ